MEKVSELQCPWHVCIRGLCPAWYSGVIWSLPGSLVASVMEMFTTEHSAGGSCLVLAMRTWTRHTGCTGSILLFQEFWENIYYHPLQYPQIPSVHLVAMAATRIAVIILTATIITYHAFLIYIVCLFDCESLWFIMIHYESVFWYVLMVITKLFPLPFPGQQFYCHSLDAALRACSGYSSSAINGLKF